MDTMQQMSLATQNIQQATLSNQQIINSFPSDGLAATTEIDKGCTIKNDCFGAYVGVGVFVVCLAFMLFRLTPLYSKYDALRKKKNV